MMRFNKIMKKCVIFSVIGSQFYQPLAVMADTNDREVVMSSKKPTSELPLASSEYIKNQGLPSPEIKETVPQETAPKETTPKETAPKETAPKETAPKETAPKETAPKETAPKGTAPKETAPKETTPLTGDKQKNDLEKADEKVVTVEAAPFVYELPTTGNVKDVKLSVVLKSVKVNGQVIADKEYDTYIKYAITDKNGKVVPFEKLDSGNFGIYTVTILNKENNEELGKTTLTFSENITLTTHSDIKLYTKEKIERNSIIKELKGNRSTDINKAVFEFDGNTLDFDNPTVGTYKGKVVYQDAEASFSVEVLENQTAIIYDDTRVATVNGKSYLKINQSEQRELQKNDNFALMVVKEAKDPAGKAVDAQVKDRMKDRTLPLLPGKDDSMKIKYQVAKTEFILYLDVSIGKTEIVTNKVAYKIAQGENWSPFDEIVNNKMTNVFGEEVDIQGEYKDNIKVTYENTAKPNNLTTDFPSEPGTYDVIYSYFGYEKKVTLEITPRDSYIKYNDVDTFYVNETIWLLESEKEDLPWTQFLIKEMVENNKVIQSDEIIGKLETTVSFTKDKQSESQTINQEALFDRTLTDEDIGTYTVVFSIKNQPGSEVSVKFEVVADKTVIPKVVNDVITRQKGEYFGVNLGSAIYDYYTQFPIYTGQKKQVQPFFKEWSDKEKGKEGSGLTETGQNWYVLDENLERHKITEYFKLGTHNDMAEITGKFQVVFEYHGHKSISNWKIYDKSQASMSIKKDNLTISAGSDDPVTDANKLIYLETFVGPKGENLLDPQNEELGKSKLKLEWSNGKIPLDKDGKVVMKSPNDLFNDYQVVFNYDTYASNLGGDIKKTMKIRVLNEVEPVLKMGKTLIRWGDQWDPSDSFINGLDEHKNSLTSEDVGKGKKISYKVFADNDEKEEIYDSETADSPLDTKDKGFNNRTYYVVFSYKYGEDKAKEVTAKVPLIILGTTPTLTLSQTEKAIPIDDKESFKEADYFEKLVTPQSKIKTDFDELVKNADLKVAIDGKEEAVKAGDKFTVTYTYDLKEPGFTNPSATLTVTLIDSTKFAINGKLGVTKDAQVKGISKADLQTLVFDSATGSDGKPIEKSDDKRITYEVYSEDFDLASNKPNKDSLIEGEEFDASKARTYFVRLILMDGPSTTYGKGSLEITDDSNMTLNEVNKFAAGEQEGNPDATWDPYIDGIVELKDTSGEIVEAGKLKDLEGLTVTIQHSGKPEETLEKISLKTPGHYQVTYKYFENEQTIDVYVYGKIMVKMVYQTDPKELLADHNPEHSQVSEMKTKEYTYDPQSKGDGVTLTPVKFEHFTFQPDSNQNNESFEQDFLTKDQEVLLKYTGETWLAEVEGSLDFKGKLQPEAQVLDKPDGVTTLHVESTELQPKWQLKGKLEGFKSNLDDQLLPTDKIDLKIDGESVTNDTPMIMTGEEKDQKITIGKQAVFSSEMTKEASVAIGKNSFDWAKKGATFEAAITWTLETQANQFIKQAVPLKEEANEK